MSSGRDDRHLRRMRAEYAHRRDVVVESVSRYAPRLRVSGLAAAIHAVLHLPPGTDNDAFVARARAAGIGLTGMNRLSVHGTPGDPRLVLGFGNTGPEAIDAGVRRIADLLGAAARGASGMRRARA